MTNIRVTVADDHPMVLAGLSMLIRAEADLELVGEATSGTDALHLIQDKKSDIAIIDISLPLMNGIVLARRLSADCLSTRIIVLTQHEDRACMSQALGAGARGYVLKKSAAQCLVNAIRGVLVGGLYVDPAMAAHLFLLTGKPMASNVGKPVFLTSRETEVLKLVANGPHSQGDSEAAGPKFEFDRNLQDPRNQKAGHQVPRGNRALRVGPRLACQH